MISALYFITGISVFVQAARLSCSCQTDTVCSVGAGSLIRCTEATYDVAVFTGSEIYGDTVASVYVSLIGRDGSINDTRLYARDGIFHENTNESVVIGGGNLGPLLHLMLETKERNHNGWFVDKVEVRTRTAGSSITTTFPAGLWLDANEYSMETSVILNATANLP